ncbi:pathogenesis-related thaumatin-like protein 3.5 [Magnolia sinica]|uniref:pathogenesis-related thaumatin-like protein 3.5 n=1 Tax=Magnolia sinica TaxID=86752 RepID=UPI00265AE121|nr:pathogenesis-related thaumatin-like protein 3.5 [Magnolia sinica]
MTSVSDFLLFISLQHVFISGVLSASFTLTNNCTYTVWPGVYPQTKEPLSPTGFVLQRGESKTLSIPNSWSGTFWGRTHCTVDPLGNFVCGTGDCESGKLECTQTGGEPVTLVEFSLNGFSDPDFYDVSLVDGFNLPVLVVPQGGNGSCRSTGCVEDLNVACPSELRVPVEGGNEIMACRSACQTFGGPQHCCGRIYGTNCTTTSYSNFFKEACPRAYNNQFDATDTTFRCASTAYVITFCPTIGSEKPSNAPKELPLVNNTMVSVDGHDASHALPRFQHGQLLVLAVAVLGASWPLPLF